MTTLVKDYMPLSHDLLFKEAFTHKDNRHILIYFLSVMTNFSKEYLSNATLIVKYESIFDKTKVNDKSMRGDIIIEFDDYKINLECYSIFDEMSFYKSMSYAMRLFSTQLDRSKEYNLLEKIHQINIVDKVEYKFDPSVSSEYAITNISNPLDIKLGDKFRILYYRIDTAKGIEYNKDNLRVRWLRFIGARSAEERKQIAEGDELLMEFDNWIEEYVNDEKTKTLFGKWGEIIAENKGYRNGITEIAKNLLNMKLPINDIAKATGLSIIEINKLQEDVA